jgi:hypothetical protein
MDNLSPGPDLDASEEHTMMIYRSTTARSAGAPQRILVGTATWTCG